VRPQSILVFCRNNEKDHSHLGLISGAISSLMMIATVPFADRIGHSYVVGYATIVLSLSACLLWRPLLSRQRGKSRSPSAKPSSSASPSR